MTTLVIIQARMSSTRFPGKVLIKLQQKPLLQWMIERVEQCSLVDKVVIATSTCVDDDPISEWCAVNNRTCYRGDLENVLSRFYHAATHFNAQTIIRLTADCPIIDPKVIDEHIYFYQKHNYDYVSNGPVMTYPDGMGVEVFSYQALKKTYQEATLFSEKEHVTAYIYKHPEVFTLFNMLYKKDYSGIRITIDYPEDFTLVKNIADALQPTMTSFSLEDIINYIEKNPDILNLNNKHSPNEGYELSLLKD
jgi:spore coat polysaccharide biosynthesis protein SpsF